jgi:hypothetical protein
MLDLFFNPRHFMLSAERSCQEFVNFVKKGVLETTVRQCSDEQSRNRVDCDLPLALADF